MIVAEAPVSVIITDDSSTVRKFIENALSGMARIFHIVSVDNGEEALKQLKSRRFDIAFLDLQMPLLGGVEVMGALKVMNETTFAVAMSNQLTEHNKTLLKSFGAYNFLHKPFSEATVRNVIKSYDIIKAPKNVLIVDDSATVRRVVRKVLSRSIFNLNLMEADDGISALEIAQDNDFKIIFTDFNMPNMTGVELAEKLAGSAPGAHVILMSTELSQAISNAATKVGARAFLKKPFYPDDVDTILHHLFGLPHLQLGKAVKLFATT